MLNLHPQYKNSKTYNILESKWQKSFLQAQAVLPELRGFEKANEILKPYKGITQKTLFIQSLLKEYKVYEKFKLSISREEFKIAFEYVKLHPFLKEFPEYKNLIHYAEAIYKKAINFMQTSEFNSAVKLLTILQDFPEYKDEAKDIIQNLKINKTFFDAVNNNNLKLAYKMLDTNFELNETINGKVLQAKWNEDVLKANHFVLHRDITQLNNLLKKYYEIPR